MESCLDPPKRLILYQRPNSDPSDYDLVCLKAGVIILASAFKAGVVVVWEGINHDVPPRKGDWMIYAYRHSGHDPMKHCEFRLNDQMFSGRVFLQWVLDSLGSKLESTSQAAASKLLKVDVTNPSILCTIVRLNSLMSASLIDEETQGLPSFGTIWNHVEIEDLKENEKNDSLKADIVIDSVHVIVSEEKNDPFWLKASILAASSPEDNKTGLVLVPDWERDCCSMVGVSTTQDVSQVLINLIKPCSHKNVASQVDRFMFTDVPVRSLKDNFLRLLGGRWKDYATCLPSNNPIMAIFSSSNSPASKTPEVRAKPVKKCHVTKEYRSGGNDDNEKGGSFIYWTVVISAITSTLYIAKKFLGR